MPPKRRYNNNYRRGQRRARNPQYVKRKRYYKRKRNQYPKAVNLRMTTGVPDRVMIKLKYVQETPFFDAVGASPSLACFRGNGPYDPYQTGIGSQPVGYDEWCAFYSRYRVHGSKCKVDILNLNTNTANSSVMFTLIPSASVLTSALNPVEIAQNRYGKYVLLSPSSGGYSPRIISNYMSTKKILGVKSINPDEYSSPVNTFPVEQWFWNIQALNINFVPQTFDCVSIITVTYYMEFFGRKELDQS